MFRADNLAKRLFLTYIVFGVLLASFSIAITTFILKKETRIIIETARKDAVFILRDDIELLLISGQKSYVTEIEATLDAYPYLIGLHVYDANLKRVFSYKKKDYRELAPAEFRLSSEVRYRDRGLEIYSFLSPIFLSPLAGMEPEPLGYFQLDLDGNYFLKPQKQLLLIEALAYLLFAVILGAVSVFLSRKIATPLNDLVTHIREVRDKRFGTKIERGTGLREIDNLIATFNEMAEELKEYHEKLQESHERLRIVAEFTADWEYWQGPGGEFIYVSPSCREITGYAPEDFKRDQTLYERIIHPEDLPRWRDHYQRAHRDHREFTEVEFRIITASGQTKWISHVCSPVYAESGEFLGIRGSNRDISDKKELEAQFLEAQKMESIARLAGGVSHDINNLMAAIVGQAELMLLELEEGSKTAERARKIVSIAQKASSLTDQLLNYAKGGQFNPEPVILNQVIRETVDLQESNIPRGITLEYRLEEDLWEIMGDRHQLSQVVMNLILNAAEAIEGEGRITIETKNVKVEGERRDLPPGRYVHLRVEDTGEGMDQETAEKIFEPFFTTKEFGRGLGLAAVFGIVKNHRGHLRVRSRPGEGTAFEIFFPVRAPSPPNEDQGEPRQDQEDGHRQEGHQGG